MHVTKPLLENTDFPSLKRGKLETVQINLGYVCNQQCLHCHVNAGPNRKEIMSKKTMTETIEFLRSSQAKVVDLTGGAPELNPNFRDFVSTVHGLGIHIIDRCNLTILSEPGQEDLADFLASKRVEITASLPCYLEENVDKQRGKGVFNHSISGLQRLNQLGYGKENSGLTLNLVYNPQGASLPPSQQELEAAYKKMLKERYGIVFNQLFTITNMPIQRFGSMLVSKGEFDTYMNVLKNAYHPDNLKGVMCRSLISLDWEGYVYDCDFNQMLGLNLSSHNTSKLHISDINKSDVEGKPIIVMDHCYGCTAGQGSSCGGALS